MSRGEGEKGEGGSPMQATKQTIKKMHARERCCAAADGHRLLPSLSDPAPCYARHGYRRHIPKPILVT
eukprot:scaffold12101_cov110-Isochrysis_galbana.AAC.2